MTKGKFGLSTAAIAVIAFGFAALRQPTSVLLVCGFALLAEKDEWLNKQAMQALLLTIAYYLAELVTGWIFGGLARFFGWVKLYDAVSAMGKVGSFVGDVLYLALIVFSVLAALRVLRGKDARLPFIAKMAGGDFTAAIKSKAGAAAPAQAVPPVQAAPVQTQYTPPVQPSAPVQTQYAPPAQPAVPMQTPPTAIQAAPAPAAGLCPACSAPLHEDSRFCTECGAKTEPVQPAYAAAAPAPPRLVPPLPASPASPAYMSPPAQTAYAPQQTYAPQPPAYSGQPESESLRVGQYIGMLLLMFVPILSVILLFMWSFGGSINLNKKNFARAMLIVSAIGIVLSIIFSTALIGIMGELFGGYY